MIDEIRNHFQVGYICLVSVRHARYEADYKRKIVTSKAFRQIARSMNIRIYADVISHTYRKRKTLIDIIDAFSNNTTGHTHPKGCLVVSSINDLGTKPEEIRETYTLLHDNDISVLVLSSPKLSTANFNGSYADRANTFETLLSSISLDDVQIRNGRVEIDRKVEENFIKVYWDYENYFIPESIIYYNNYIHINKKAFNMLCAKYESSPRYAEDEQREVEVHGIDKKPKRRGKVTQEIEYVIHCVEDSSASLQQALSRINSMLPPGKHLVMTETSYQRYKLKHTEGRSLMTKLTINLKSDLLVEQYIFDNLE